MLIIRQLFIFFYFKAQVGVSIVIMLKYYFLLNTQLQYFLNHQQELESDSSINLVLFPSQRISLPQFYFLYLLNWDHDAIILELQYHALQDSLLLFFHHYQLYLDNDNYLNLEPNLFMIIIMLLKYYLQKLLLQDSYINHLAILLVL